MEAFIGTVILFAGNFAPRDWAFCNGQLLFISQYQTLFSLLGTTYGGDGQTTFALPDLRGRVPMGTGQGLGLTDRNLGEVGGTETETLTLAQLPAHNHPLLATNMFGDQGNPANAALASTVDTVSFGPDVPIYKTAAALNTPMAAGSIGSTGNSLPHNNMPPYLGLNYIICMEGIYPPHP